MQKNWNVLWISGSRIQGKKQSGKYLFVPFNHNITHHVENKSQRYDYCKTCCISKRLRSDLIQLYSGHLTGPYPAELCLATWQRSICCFEFHLARCLLTDNVSLSQSDTGRNPRGCGWVGQCAGEKEEKHWSLRGMSPAPKRKEVLGILAQMARLSSHLYWSQPISFKVVHLWSLWVQQLSGQSF